MQLKVIKNDQEHQEALSALIALMDADPQAGSNEENQLEVLALLIEKYEEEHYPVALPDPVDAIRFRMEQQGLTQKDLIPYMGSAARVSEVLNRKRSLSLSMMRKLHDGLGIPAQVLLQSPAKLPASQNDVNWSAFPLKELCERGAFGQVDDKLGELKEYAEEHMRHFFDTLGVTSEMQTNAALLRSVLHQRGQREMSKEALFIWQTLVQKQVSENPLQAVYQPLDDDFLRQVVQVSWSEQGPALAKELLNQRGIHLIAEPHFKKTYLDGAAFWGVDNKPVVALTLRYDRLDNFWFTLLHELAHVRLHLDANHSGFFDDLKTNDGLDDVEHEADELAGCMLLDAATWQSQGFHTKTSKQAIQQFASEQRIHPAIIAGRIQYEANEYRCHSGLLGRGQVRCHFFDK